MSACAPGLPVYAAAEIHITGHAVVVVTAPHLPRVVTLFDDQGVKRLEADPVTPLRATSR